MPFHQPVRFACRASWMSASVASASRPYTLASSLTSPGDTVTRAVSIRQILVSDHSSLAAASLGLSPAAALCRSSAPQGRCGTVGSSAPPWPPPHFSNIADRIFRVILHIAV
jgi:hypothetical protein